MALDLAKHQYAGDARNAFAFGGSGKGRIVINQAWATGNLAVNSKQLIYRLDKPGWVSNFTLKTSVNMDPHDTPTLTWDVGTASSAGAIVDDDEFMAGITAALAFAGSTVNTASSGTATAPAGFAMAADTFIVVSIKAASATATAGVVSVGFDFTPYEG